MREQVELAAKIYKCHSSAKGLYGTEYPDKIKWYKEELQNVMSGAGLSELEAILFLGKMDCIKDNPMALILFMAAAVELIEEPKVK